MVTMGIPTLFATFKYGSLPWDGFNPDIPVNAHGKRIEAPADSRTHRVSG